MVTDHASARAGATRKGRKTVKRMDVMHHQPEDVRRYLRVGIEIVAEVTDDREVSKAILPTIVTLLSSKSVTVTTDPADIIAASMAPSIRKAS